MSLADFRSELMGGLNAPLGVEDTITPSVGSVRSVILLFLMS